jgi:hypothetical protein
MLSPGEDGRYLYSISARQALPPQKPISRHCNNNMAFEERIDTHAHIVPPFYLEACQNTGHGKPDNIAAFPVILISSMALEYSNSLSGMEPRGSLIYDERVQH